MDEAQKVWPKCQVCGQEMTWGVGSVAGIAEGPQGTLAVDHDDAGWYQCVNDDCSAHGESVFVGGR
jgi:hypothetical protein